MEIFYTCNVVSHLTIQWNLSLIRTPYIEPDLSVLNSEVSLFQEREREKGRREGEKEERERRKGGEALGLDTLCQHNFESNRQSKELFQNNRHQNEHKAMHVRALY